MTPAASAGTGTGTLYVTDASDVQMGSTATVSIYITNDFDPKIGAYNVRMYFDNTVVNPVSIQRFNASFDNTFADYVLINGFNAYGYDNGDLLLATVTLESLKNDGSASELGMQMWPGSFADINDDSLTASIQNGTFTSKDEVAPVITLSTPATVSSTFNIAGTITDVGGMGTAQATLSNATHTVPVALPLSGSAPAYTYDQQVTWPIEDGVTLTITAIDAAGNTATTSQVIDVVNVGFSQPAPTGYINATPAQAQAFMSQMDKTSVTMILGSASYGPIPLTVDTTTDYAKGTMPPALPDDTYWVNVSGTDTFGDERYLNWTFTLDTTAPVINSFTITDSDGDGYIEAGETLTLNWNVAADASFDHVALVDRATGQEVWSSDSISGTATTLIVDGNRDLAFRAYDRAGNFDSRGFHLYYDYMIWVNSTKAGEVSGIDTTYTATKDISRTEVSSITLYGCTVTLPTLNKLDRAVTSVGQVTSDTYVTVDMNANRTLTGSETYRNAWVLDPNTNLDFLAKVSHAHNAILILGEANESYIADLIHGGRGSMHSVNYTELIKKTAYIFIDGGWTKITVYDDGTISMDAQSGTPITNAGNISATLRHPANQVDLNNGYRLNAQGLAAITPAPGDYALAAIAMDGDRIGLLGVMPIVVMESGDQGSITPTSVQQNATLTAQFRYDTPCERLGVVVLRDVAYNGTALIDAATIGKDSLRLNLTYNGIPATQKLAGNVYVSPSSGKYVVANTNQASISTSGLEPGTYRVYMVAQSANGTMQAYGQHTLTITPSVTPTPTPTPAPHGGGGGGGGGSSAPTTYTGTGTLLTGSAGTVLKTIRVNAEDNGANLLVPIGTKALDKDGNPLKSISLSPLAGSDVPAVPTGAVFQFAGYAYEAGPSGATFEPGITLTLTPPDDFWNSLDLTNNQLTLMWYNQESGLWEEIQATISPGSKTVTATLTHFSIYALFTEPVTTPVTPTETTTTAPTTQTTTPPAGEQPSEGLPVTMILSIFAVVVIIAAAGYFFMMRK
jgi:hypothetical protein